MLFRKKKSSGIAETLRSAFPGWEIRGNVAMGDYTSFRCGGRAAALVEPRSVDELAALLAFLGRPAAPPYLLLGNGTNTLFADSGYEGVVIRLGQYFSYNNIVDNTVTAGAGYLIAALAKDACRRGLTGMEFATGIPGSAGGAVFMNAGAYGSDIAAIVREVKTLSPDGMLHIRGAEELGLGYRRSVFMENGEIILEAVFELAEGRQEEIDALVRDLTKRRTSKQPLSYPSAGSFFKRPERHFAGALIEASGLKGLRLGGAQVSALHAGFLINAGGATATDVIDLMKMVQETVLHDSGVLLEPEVRIIGS